MTNYDQKYADSERLLSSEGDSLAELLENFGERISPVLVSTEHRDRLLSCAQQIPASAAALPFGFMLPLLQDPAGAVLAISLASGTQSAAHYERIEKNAAATAAEAGLSRLLGSTRELDTPSPVQQITGRKWILEYDLFGHAEDYQRHPWVVFRTSEQPIIERHADREALEIVLNEIFDKARWSTNANKIDQILYLHEVLEAPAEILTLGVFAADDIKIRVGVGGFQDSEAVSNYLARIDCVEHQRTAVKSVIGFFENRQILDDLSIRVDLGASGLGSTIRLGLYTKKRAADDPRHWLDSIQAWNPFLKRLQDLVEFCPKKISALSKWQSPPEILFGRSGLLFLIRGIHHIEVSVCDGRIDDVKAHVFCLLCPSLTETA